MGDRKHIYHANLAWTGRDKAPSFRNHVRTYDISAGTKPIISGSSDAAFRGDATRWNPEDLLIASLSACHHL
jgi:organic hydroperoxide reductase OsmC/OhrA